MIGTTLQLVTHELNEFICRRLGSDPSSPKVVLSPLVTPGGETAQIADTVLVVTLVSITKTDAVGYNRHPVPEPGTAGFAYRPALDLDLKILIAANFNENQMQSGLDLLTSAIAFLDAKPRWTHNEFPGLSETIEGLTFCMEKLDFDQLEQLWRAIGGTFMPSVLYNVRMLTMDDGQITITGTPVSEA